MDGVCRLIRRCSRRSILRCGVGLFLPQAERLTSTMPLVSLNGCEGRTVMAASSGISIQISARMTERRPKSKVGYWGWHELLSADNLAPRYSLSTFRIFPSRTKAGAGQPSQTTRYPRVIWPCHISGRIEDVTVPHAPFPWESPRLELIFSMRVPIRNATEDCSDWELSVGVIKSLIARESSASLTATYSNAVRGWTTDRGPETGPWSSPVNARMRSGDRAADAI
jgi:hypothetical protein